MQWNDGKQITIAGESAPESDRGPAVSVGQLDNNTFYLAYVGTGGENLYLSYLEIDPDNPLTWQDAKWQGNKRMKLPNGFEPTANDRPATAFFCV